MSELEKSLFDGYKKEGGSNLLESLQAILKEPIDLVEFAVNDWGSCQYSSALDMFNILTALEKQESKEKIHNTFEISFKGVHSIKEVVDLFLQGCNDDLEEADKIEAYSFKEYEDFFQFAKESAWDLWSAALEFTELIFDDFRISNQPEPAGGVGPILNIMAQSDNYLVGLYCWLLVSEGIIKDSNCFADFDT